MAQVGHDDPTLTMRIYMQLLKRKRADEYRQRVDELLGTSPLHMEKPVSTRVELRGAR